MTVSLAATLQGFLPLAGGESRQTSSSTSAGSGAANEASRSPPNVKIEGRRPPAPSLDDERVEAVYLHFENLMAPDKGIPDQAPDRICLERLLGDNLSVSNNMWVILYSEKSNPNATFLAWTLDLLGHKKVGVVNGGWEKWISESFRRLKSTPLFSLIIFLGR